jgi:hypothetical protein
VRHSYSTPSGQMAQMFRATERESASESLPMATEAVPQNSRKDVAINLAIKGLWLIPLCWPDEEGNCACGKGHTGHDVGKAPLTKRGVNDSSNSVKDIFNWWNEYPQANIGIDLDRSGLVDIAPDSEKWLETFKDRGLPPTASFASGGGAGHEHYLYQRPADTPLINVNKKSEYDLQPRGYCVAPDSSHQSGRTYEWTSDFPWKDAEDLSFAPEWAMEEIQEKWNAHTATPEIELDLEEVQLRPGLVKGTLQEWWAGERAATQGDGTVDRSLTLFIIGKLLARQGATPAEIVTALRDRDESLGYFKYSQRKDGGIKEYSAIAGTVTAATEGAASGELSWEEIAAEVGSEYFVTVDDDGQRETARDGITEYQGFDGDGAGRRRFTGVKGAEIRQIQDRLSKIWLKVQRHLGNIDAITRANNCGGIYGQTCDEGHITAAPEKERRNCKQRLHPRCLATNVRKHFYIPKTRGQTKVDNEGDMDINVAQVGKFDCGEDPFYWPPNIRRQLDFARDHFVKLRRRKGAPQGLKDSFLGLRADFRRGCLTIDVVIAGGRDSAVSEWLKEGFAEIATRPVEVETFHPLDPKDVVTQFGNLMANAFVYTDEEECLAMLDALKNWQVVQPLGKFRRKSAVAEEKCAKPSIGEPPEVPIESSAHPTGGGGSPPPPCPECGGPTRSAGFRTGRWAKVKGTWSGKLTWMLLADDADPGGGLGAGFEEFQKDVVHSRSERVMTTEEVLLV